MKLHCMSMYPLQNVTKQQAWGELHCKTMHNITITPLIWALNNHYHYLNSCNDFITINSIK